MTFRLPDSPQAFADATWDDILPYYQELAARPLDTATVEAWLRDWARLEEMVAEASAIAYNAYSTDTANEAKEALVRRRGSRIVSYQMRPARSHALPPIAFAVRQKARFGIPELMCTPPLSWLVVT